MHFPHRSRQVFDINNNWWVWKSISSVKMQAAVVNGIKGLQSRRDGMWIQNVSISNTEITVDCTGFFMLSKEKQALYRKKSIFILDVWVKWSTWALNDNLLSSKVFVWWSSIWVTIRTSCSWVKTFEEQQQLQEKQPCFQLDGLMYFSVYPTGFKKLSWTQYNTTHYDMIYNDMMLNNMNQCDTKNVVQHKMK